jgi:hypothetical protein
MTVANALPIPTDRAELRGRFVVNARPGGQPITGLVLKVTPAMRLLVLTPDNKHVWISAAAINAGLLTSYFSDVEARESADGMQGAQA